MGKIYIKLKNGYSLVEVLVAMMILIVGILPIMSMFPQVFSILQRSTENEERARIGLQVVEYMKLGGYPNLLTVSALSIREGDVDLTPDSGSYKATEFEKHFITPAIRGATATTTPDFFILNSKKGMNLGQAKIRYAVRAVDVNCVDSTGVSRVNYTNFIVGAVIVGTGRDVGNTITGKEKETRMQFMVTPIE